MRNPGPITRVLAQIYRGEVTLLQIDERRRLKDSAMKNLEGRGLIYEIKDKLYATSLGELRLLYRAITIADEL